MKEDQRKDARTQGRKEKQQKGDSIAALRPGAFAFDENALSRQVVEAAIEVHRTLGGPGLLESVYEEALVWELQHRGLDVQRQLALPIPYKGQTLASPLRIDLMVCGKVVSSARRCRSTTPCSRRKH